MAGFQQVKVNRDLEFVNFAAHSPNVKGPMMTELNIFDEHFNNDTDENDWTESTQGGTITGNSAVLGGAVTIATGGASDGEGEISRLATWGASKNCGMEARIKMSGITQININVGFVDVVNNTDNEIAGMLSGSGVFTAPSVTADFALFVLDTGEASAWYVGASKNGNEGTPVAATPSTVPVTDYIRLRVQTNTDGDVTFYLNDEAVGFLHEGVVATSSDLLTPYVACMENSSSTRTLTIDRITVWQDA